MLKEKKSHHNKRKGPWCDQMSVYNHFVIHKKSRKSIDSFSSLGSCTAWMLYLEHVSKMEL